MSTRVQEGDILAGKYKVERVLATGGMGVVVAAIHQQLDKRVALKFLLPEAIGDGVLVGRFLREAKAAVRLRSEHVARVLDVGTSDAGSPYIVMEYLEGTDLSDLLEAQGRQPIEIALTYVLQAAEAVAEAHALGIVHRDLKPANLFLTQSADGEPCVKVLDFGISKVASDAEQNLTGTATIMGTPRYMAPEQLRSSRSVDHRTDIWALGMIVYELVTGVVAYRRDTLPELCMAILFDPVVRPRDILTTIPEALDKVIMRALEKEPQDRFQSLSELAWALAPLVEGGDRLAARVSRVLGELRRPGGVAASARETVAADPALEPTSTRLPVDPPPSTEAKVPALAPAEADAAGSTAVPLTSPPRLLLPVVAAGLLVAIVVAVVAVRGHTTSPRVVPAVIASSPPLTPTVTELPPASAPSTAVAVVAPPVSVEASPAPVTSAPPAARRTAKSAPVFDGINLKESRK